MSAYFIENEHLKVQVNQKGAELAGIQAKATGQEYIWEADKNFWGRHSAILFPIVGRLKDNQYHLEGQTYSMKQHGFARDTPFELVQSTTNQLTLVLTDSENSKLQYPYAFKLMATYTLRDNKLDITYTVENADTKTIFFSLGAHPAFKAPLKMNEQRSDYSLVFNQKETATRQLIDNGLRTGERASVLTESDRLQLADDLFDDDALIFEQLQSTQIDLVNGSNEKILTFEFEGFPYFGIWSAKGVPDFVCLEPWHGIADTVHTDGNYQTKEGVIALEIGKQFSCTHSVIVHL